MINGKPRPDIYLLAVQKLGLIVPECVAFEDSEMGAKATIAAGLKVVVPDLQYQSDFIRENCHQLASSLKDWLIELWVK